MKYKYKNIHRIIFFALIILLSLPFCLFSSAQDLSVSARCAFVYIPDSDITVYEKNATVRRPMASTTKIMTALVALENASLDDVIEIPSEAVGIEGTSAYLREGDEFTVENLLYAVLLQSANDAAAALAIGVGGGIEEFADLMNEKAREMGLSDTHFTNPHGLDDPDHYTSARDLAMMTAYAIKNPEFKSIVSTYRKSFSSLDGECVRTVVNHNKMLLLYEGANGVKTGFTKKSGRCLVSSAQRNGLDVICVTLDAPSDWQDHKAMLDLAFNSYEKRIFASAGELEYVLPTLNGDKLEIRCRNASEMSAVLKKNEGEGRLVVELDKFIVAPVDEGDVVGQAYYTVDGKTVASSPLVAAENVKTQKIKKGLFGA